MRSHLRRSSRLSNFCNCTVKEKKLQNLDESAIRDIVGSLEEEEAAKDKAEAKKKQKAKSKVQQRLASERKAEARNKVSSKEEDDEGDDEDDDDLGKFVTGSKGAGKGKKQ